MQRRGTVLLIAIALVVCLLSTADAYRLPDWAISTLRRAKLMQVFYNTNAEPYSDTAADTKIEPTPPL